MSYFGVGGHFPSSPAYAAAPSAPPAAIREVDETLDLATTDPMIEAVSIVPCGHTYNKSTVERFLHDKTPCPQCRGKIDGFIPNYTVRSTAASRHPLAHAAAATPVPDAVAYYEKAKVLHKQGRFDDAVAACVAALSLNATYPDAQNLLDRCLTPQGKAAVTSAPAGRVEKPICTISAALCQQLTDHLFLSPKQIASSCWNLNGHPLSEQNLALLMTGLESCPHVTSLYLSNCQIDSKKMALLARFLSHNTTLNVLDLSHNDLGLEGIEALIGALATNRQLPLSALSLRSSIREVGLSRQSEYSRHPELKYRGIHRVCEWLASTGSLTFLDLSDCQEPGSAWPEFSAMPIALILKALAGNARLKLETLYVENVPIYPEHVALLKSWLSAQKALKALALQIGGGAMCCASPEDSAERCRLENQASRSSEQMFPVKIETRDFEVYYSALMTRGACTFQRDVNFYPRARHREEEQKRSQILVEQKAEQRLIQDIFTAFAVLKSPVEQLCLRGSHIGPESVPALVSFLKKATNLSSIDLCNNRLGSQGVQALFSSLLHLHLEEIDLSANGEGVGAGLSQWLGQNTTLTKLSLGGHAGQLEAMVQASLEATRMSVQNRALDRNPTYTLEGACSSMPSDASSKFQYEYNQNYTNKLQELTEQHNRSIKQKLLSRGLADVTALMQVLSRNKAIPLQILNLDGMCVGAAGIKILGQWMAGNRTLEVLSLKNNFLDIEALKALAAELAKNPLQSLCELHLQGNGLDKISAQLALQACLPEKCKLYL